MADVRRIEAVRRCWSCSLAYALLFARAEERAGVLDAVARRLDAAHGTRPDSRAWERVRPVTFRHPLARRRLLQRIFDRGPFPCGGDTNAVAQVSVDPFDPCANPLCLSSLHLMMEAGTWDATRAALPGGQSGNPLSSHYDVCLRSGGVARASRRPGRRARSHAARATAGSGASTRRSRRVRRRGVPGRYEDGDDTFPTAAEAAAAAERRIAEIEAGEHRRLRWRTPSRPPSRRASDPRGSGP